MCVCVCVRARVCVCMRVLLFRIYCLQILTYLRYVYWMCLHYFNNSTLYWVLATHTYPTCVHIEASLQTSLKSRHRCHESLVVSFLKIDTTSGTGPKNVIETSSNSNQRHRLINRIRCVIQEILYPTRFIFTVH